ncbi:hypothetical protein MTO96_023602 [Rhipicephalus appendiculatus]
MGKQVQIVSVRPDHSLQLNREELERILLAPNVKDKHVAVVSIMGAFRMGKSFLQNFLLRYMRSDDKANWMGDEDTPLEGFSWSTSSERNTQGVNVWDEVFLVPTSTGDKLAVLLMDTQGGVRQRHLKFVAEYGKLAQENTKGSEFQKLVFLIRDWQFSNFPHGAMGGRQCLEKFMSTSANQLPDKKDLRKSLSSCFSSTDCFLMPQPGTGTTTEGFDGRLSKLDSTFKQNLGELVPWLVAAENLEAKKIAGKKITCEQLMNYMTDGQQPHVATILQVTVDESNRNAKEEAKAFYEEEMRKVTYENVQELEKMHKILLEKALDKFRASGIIGGHNFETRYLGILEKEINGIATGMDNISRMAHEDDFPGAGGLKPEAFFDDLASPTSGETREVLDLLLAILPPADPAADPAPEADMPSPSQANRTAPRRHFRSSR